MSTGGGCARNLIDAWTPGRAVRIPILIAAKRLEHKQGVSELVPKSHRLCSSVVKPKEGQLCLSAQQHSLVEASELFWATRGLCLVHSRANNAGM